MYELNYVHMINSIRLANYRPTRNAKTKGTFGEYLRVTELGYRHFPLLYGRKLFYQGVFGELAAFLRGPKCLADFKKFGCNYWDNFADEEGNLNVDYGNTWRDFEGVDQLAQVVKSLKTDRHGRRHLISGWRPHTVKDTTLPCCHYSYQWYVNNLGELEMIWNQRSVDLMLGLPSDIILAAAWNILMAQTVGLRPGTLHFMLGDVHIYKSHHDSMLEYLAVACINEVPKSKRATWKLAPEATVFNFVPSMLVINNYDPAPAIKFKLEV